MSHDPESIRPYFIPASIDYSGLPPEIQLALTEIIEPLYRELVLGAHSALERSVGISHVYVDCIDVIEQYLQAGDEFASLEEEVASPMDRHMRRVPYFRVHDAKIKSASMLLRIAEMQRRAQVQPPDQGADESADDADETSE